MRRISIVLLAVALTAAACSSSSGVIATVGEAEITEADLGVLFQSETLPVNESLRQTVFAVIAREVFVQALDAEFGVTIDQAEIDTLYESLISEMEASGMTADAALGIEDASNEMVRFNAELGVIRQQVIELRVAEPDIIEAFFAEPASYTTVCVRHVLVETEPEALEALERLEGGEDFATVAAEVSLDTGSPNGDLGCGLAGRYVPEFAQGALDAEIGELFGPVQTDFGFHLMIVDDRSAPTEEELAADPQAFLSDQELGSVWAEWFNAQLQNAEVTLDERFGFWSPIGIIPPDRPDLVPEG